MFKKFRKKRLSLKSKSKSASLRDINVVGTFVLQTAKIMSASAESLDTISCNSSSLLSILDQVFQPTSKACTTATSGVSSSKANSLFNSHSNRSGSLNNSSPKTELLVSELNNIEEPSQDIVSITEENGSYSELNESCITNPMKVTEDTSEVTEITEITEPISPTFQQFSHCNNMNSEYQKSEDPSEVEPVQIVAEDASSSGVFTSCNTNLTDTSVVTIPKSPRQRQIIKHPLKKCYSFNDIDIRRILSLNKRSESIQTFTSTNATLSIEIERCSPQGNDLSDVKITASHRLISRDLYLNRLTMKDRVKRLWSRNKLILGSKSRIKNNIFDYNYFDHYQRSLESISIPKSKMGFYGVLTGLSRCILKLNMTDNALYCPINEDYTIYDSGTPKSLYECDSNLWPRKMSKNLLENVRFRSIKLPKGDERSEISEPIIGHEKETAEPESEILTGKGGYHNMVSTVVKNPIFLTTVIAGGMFFLLPMCNRLLKWFSSSVNLHPNSRLPSTLSEAPQTVISTLGHPTKPIYYISSGLMKLNHMKAMFPIRYHKVG